MNYTLTFLVIFSFVFIAVFGFLAMSHGQGHEGCIAVTASRIDCPEKFSALDNAIFHINAFKIFSAAVFSERFSGVSLYFYLLLFIAFFAGGVSNVFAQESAFGVSAKRVCALSNLIPQSRFISWLSIFENSPTRF